MGVLRDAADDPRASSEQSAGTATLSSPRRRGSITTTVAAQARRRPLHVFRAVRGYGSRAPRRGPTISIGEAPRFTSWDHRHKADDDVEATSPLAAIAASP